VKPTLKRNDKADVKSLVPGKPPRDKEHLKLFRTGQRMRKWLVRLLKLLERFEKMERKQLEKIPW
jgi:hypothetical protein